MRYALASLLVPGLGQFLGGRRARGLSLFGLVLVTLGLVWWATTPAYTATEATLTFKGAPSNWLWLAVPVVVWLWVIWDAAFPERPLWIPILAALVMFYSLGWRASGINAGALFGNFDRALLVLRPMLNPDFVQPRADHLEAWVELLVPCSATPLPGTNTLGSATLTLSAGCAQVGDTLTVTGSGFWADSEGQLIWQSPIGDFFPLREAGSIQTMTTRTDAQGNLTATFVVPNAIPPGIDPTLPQEQRLYIRQARTIGGFGFSFESCRVQFDPTAPPPKSGPGYEFSLNGCFVVKGIYQTVALALMATTLGTLFAIPVSFFAARNLMSANPITLAVYVVVRTLLNILRSIEALIIAIVFVVFVGLGPFAGMLALSVHTVAALAKLYSEVIEGIDPGPIEAMQATGANWLQVVRYGVVPQIVPPFTAFTIYRWDINVRSSTIVGLVGGGGIGFFLVQWINLSDFRAVSASFIAILVVVVTMDLVSAAIRERLI